MVVRQMRRAARIAGFGALTAGMLPAFLVHQRIARPADRGNVRDRWVGAWSGALLGLFGVRAHLRIASPGDALGRATTFGALRERSRDRGQLIVANHRSTADILVLLQAFGGRVVSRADLSRWPLVGASARSVGTVFVDRSDAVSGASAVRTIRSMLARGSTVIVFAEGTTFAGDEVRPFHAGAFVAALRSGADVVPVGLAYRAGSDAAFVHESFGAHLARVAAAAPSDMAMCVGPPIAVGQNVRAAELKDRAHAEVQRLVRVARKSVDGA